jgi:hypothetical protein
MTKFVGYDATQNYRDRELGIVTPGAMQRIVVVDTGQNRMDGKTKNAVLEHIPLGRSKYAQPDVGSLGCFMARSRRVSRGHPHRTFQPDGSQASLAEDTASFVFSCG